MIHEPQLIRIFGDNESDPSSRSQPQIQIPGVCIGPTLLSLQLHSTHMLSWKLRPSVRPSAVYPLWIEQASEGDSTLPDYQTDDLCWRAGRPAGWPQWNRHCWHQIRSEEPSELASAAGAPAGAPAAAMDDDNNVDRGFWQHASRAANSSIGAAEEGRHTSHNGGGGETPKEFLRATFSLPSFTPLCVCCVLRALPAARGPSAPTD